MVDVVDQITRSRIMRGIRSKDTKPEIIVRQLLHAAGFRFRLHNRKLAGTPDITLPKHRAVVFVSGCFWHGHDCHLFKWPSTRPEFWQAKIARNKANDLKACATLETLGWRHATVWECALKGKEVIGAVEVGKKLAGWLHSDQFVLVIRGSQ